MSLKIALIPIHRHYSHRAMSETGELPRTVREVHFGPNQLGSVPIPYINELKQVRQSYDPDALGDLATSIVADEEKALSDEADIDGAFELSTPVIINRFDNERQAEKYYYDHASHYQIKNPECFERENYIAPDGYYYFLVDGHRRLRATKIVAQRSGIDIEHMSIAATIHDNLTFAEALGYQLRSNISQRPPAQDEARAIALCYDDLTRNGQSTPNIKEFASQLGFSESKVRDALAFSALPGEVQMLVDEGLLSYSVVKKFSSLSKAFQYKYDIMVSNGEFDDSMDRDEYVTNGLVSSANLILKLRLEGENNVVKWIEAKTKEIFGTAAYQGQLFELDVHSHGSGKRNTSKNLATTAIGVVRYSLTTGGHEEANLKKIRFEIDGLLREVDGRLNQPPEEEPQPLF